MTNPNAIQDRLSSLLDELADSTPITDIDFDPYRVVVVSTTDNHRGPIFGVLGAVAASVVLVGGLVLVTNRTEPRPDDSPFSTPLAESSPTIVADPPAMVGLPFEVAPSELPAGWAYADLSESLAPVQSFSMFLFRDPVTGAAVSVAATPATDTSEPVHDIRESLAESGQAVYFAQGSMVWLRVAGIDADRAAELADSLNLTELNGDVLVTLDAAAGFELEWSRLESEHTTTDGAVSSIVLTTPTGTAAITLDSRDPNNRAWNHFGVPSRVGDTTAYTSQSATHSIVTGDPIDNQVSASVGVTDPADLSAAAQVLASLRRADDNTWDTIADGIAANLVQLPTTNRIDVSDVVVTEHRNPTIDAICATWQEVTRCRSSQSPLWPNDSGPVTVNLIVNDLWIIAGQIRDDQPIERPTVEPVSSQAIGTWQPTDTGASFAYAVPSATHLELTYDGNTTQGQLGYDRPIR